MSRKVLIGGGTGFIGSTLKRFLQNEGYAVTVISRTAGKDRLTWNDIDEKGIPDGTFAAVNLAGDNVLNPLRPFTENFKKTVIESRVKTTGILANAISKAKSKPAAFISMSGIGIYKPDKVKSYDENTDVGQSFDFISKLAQDWEKASKTSPEVRKIILRSGVVLGRNGGMIQQVYPQYFLGLGSWFGSGDQYFPWIHLYDLCRLVVFSIENKQVEGVVNAVAPEIITSRTFAKSFAGAMCRPALLPTPGFVCKLIFGAERSVMLLEGQKVVPRKAIEYKFPYSYPSIEEACAELAPLKYTPPPLIY